MIDYLELFKPFHMVGKLCGVLPFNLHSYIESKMSHHPRAQNGANEVQLFPATQVACNILIFAALPLLAAGWTAVRLGQVGLLSPGMNNLDGLVVGVGTFLTMLLLALSGTSRRRLSRSYAVLLLDLNKREVDSILLAKITPQDLKPVRRTAWKVLITFILLTPVACTLMACILRTATPDTFKYFSIGDPLLAVMCIAGLLATCVMPVWIIAAFLVQSAMAATFTRVKVKLLEDYLRAELYSTTTNKALNHTNYEIDEHWKARPRMWSSNLLRPPAVSAEKETKSLKSGRLFREYGHQGLEVLLATLNRELRLIEDDHKMMAEVIKAEELVSISIIVGFLVFSGYYFWGGLNDLLSYPSALINWVKACDASVMTALGLCMIWTLCEEGYQLKEQTKKIARILRRHQQASPSLLSWEETFLLEQTCNSLLESPLDYKLGQILILDRSTFATIFATILTNLIVLVQLKTPPID